jgi:hypothetical protein
MRTDTMIKKENKFFLKYKEIHKGAASSYIRKPFLIYEFATAPF